MEIISLLGIIAAIALFVYLAFKGFNLFFNAVAAVVVIILASQLPLLPTLKGPYMNGLAGFLRGYLFLFVLSAVFGKVMEDSGAVRKIALTLAGFTRKTKNQKFWTVMILPLFYFILSYVGISGFVVVFTVVAIGRELFEECDIPWIYYCYGSAGIYPAIVLGGSMQPTNVIVNEGFKLALTSGFALSVIMVAVAFATLAALLKMDMTVTLKKQEGFLPTGEPIKKLQIAAPIPEDQLPGLLFSAIPLLVPIIAIIGFKSDVLVAMSSGILLAFLLGRKNVKSLQGTLSAGIVASIVPVVNVAAAAGLAGIISITPGYKIIAAGLAGLSPMFAGSGIIMMMSAVIGSSSSPIPAFLPYIVEKMGASGVSPDIGARLAVGSSFTYMTPHNPGVVNAVSLTKLPLTQAAWVYFKTTFFPGLVAFLVAVALVFTGVFR